MKTKMVSTANSLGEAEREIDRLNRQKQGYQSQPGSKGERLRAQIPAIDARIAELRKQIASGQITDPAIQQKASARVEDNRTVNQRGRSAPSNTLSARQTRGGTTQAQTGVRRVLRPGQATIEGTAQTAESKAQARERLNRRLYGASSPEESARVSAELRSRGTAQSVSLIDSGSGFARRVGERREIARASSLAGSIAPTVSQQQKLYKPTEEKPSNGSDSRRAGLQTGTDIIQPSGNVSSVQTRQGDEESAFGGLVRFTKDLFRPTAKATALGGSSLYYPFTSEIAQSKSQFEKELIADPETYIGATQITLLPTTPSLLTLPGASFVATALTGVGVAVPIVQTGIDIYRGTTITSGEKVYRGLQATTSALPYLTSKSLRSQLVRVSLSDVSTSIQTSEPLFPSAIQGRQRAKVLIEETNLLRKTFGLPTTKREAVITTNIQRGITRQGETELRTQLFIKELSQPTRRFGSQALKIRGIDEGRALSVQTDVIRQPKAPFARRVREISQKQVQFLQSVDDVETGQPLQRALGFVSEPSEVFLRKPARPIIQFRKEGDLTQLPQSVTPKTLIGSKTALALETPEQPVKPILDLRGRVVGFEGGRLRVYGTIEARADAKALEQQFALDFPSLRFDRTRLARTSRLRSITGKRGQFRISTGTESPSGNVPLDFVSTTGSAAERASQAATLRPPSSELLTKALSKPTSGGFIPLAQPFEQVPQIVPSERESLRQPSGSVSPLRFLPESSQRPRIEQVPKSVPVVVQVPRAVPRIVQVPRSVPRSIPNVVQVPRQVPDVVQVPRQVPQLVQVPRGIPRALPDSPPPITPRFNFEYRRRKEEKPLRLFASLFGRVKTAYTPTFYGVFTELKADKKIKKRRLSGLEVRGI